MKATRSAGLLAAAILLAAGAGCGSGAPEAFVTRVESPAPPGSSEPNLALGADGTLVLSWTEARPPGHVLRFSRWEDDGGWSEPTEIASGDDWFVNWADFPSMTSLGDGTLAAHWLARTGKDTYAYGVEVALSADGGRTWSEPVIPHTDATPTEHGFVSLFPDGDGRVGAVWLDGRETAGEGHGEGEGGGPMTLRFATLDREGTIGDEALLDERVCDCCQTSAVRLEDGTVIVAYRDRSPGEIRDISVVRRENGVWSKPGPVHADGWKINGCPVNGPQLAASGTTVAAAWFTAAEEDQGQVRAAFSTDGGRSFGTPVRVDDGNPLGRVDVVMDGEGAVVSWLEDRPEGAEVRVRRVEPNGARGSALTAGKTSSLRDSGFPRMVRRGDTILVAWTVVPESGGEDASRVATAVVRPGR